MSEFDKEAEREKLREQFAEDEEDRESTERMSELLLQGATMTNKHCDVHGDPIFRYDGEEFCPSCRAAGQETGTVDPATGGSGGAPTSGESLDAGDAPAADSVPSDGVDASASEPPASVPETPVQSPPDADATNHRDVSAAPPRSSSPEPDPVQERPSASPSDGARHADLAEARTSLARTVTRFADEAERADDLARSREYLAAVEDAANALAAVRNAEK